MGKWCDRIESRPATKKGLDCPTEFVLKKQYKENPEKVEAHASQSSKWILQGQDADKKKA